jgi:PAS domain S-box-containing protein
MPGDSNSRSRKLSDTVRDATAVSRSRDADAANEYREVFTSGNNEGNSEGFKEVLVPRPESVACDELAQSERRYRRLFEAARDGILLLDVNSARIIDANPFMYQLLGYPPDALLGKELWEIGLFEDREASQAAFLRLQEVGYIRYEDLPLETQGGQRREVELVGNVYPENGHTVIQCNIRDITERKQVEQALQAALIRELHITEVLQHPLTIDVPEDAFPGLLIAASYEPAMKEAQVGGDFFDAFAFRACRKSGGVKRGPELIALAVGDVTGKGLLAAALAGRVKDVMRAFLRENHDPAQTLSRLNDYLCDAVSRIGYSDVSDSKQTFLTLSLAVINPRTGVAAISLAGSEPPAVLRKSGMVEVLEAGGLLLGIQPDMPYTLQRFRLYPGDTLLMATDGLTEARRSLPPEELALDGGPELLGYEGMLKIALLNQSTVSVRAMGQAILKEARAFGGGFRDDVCLLLARRRR